MSTPPDHRDPFQSPRNSLPASVADPTAMPLFCAVMFSFSLLACVLRIPVLFVALLLASSFLLALPESSTLALALIPFFLILSGETASVCLGVPANIGLFRKREFGVRLAYWAVAAAILAVIGWSALLALTADWTRPLLDKVLKSGSGNGMVTAPGSEVPLIVGFAVRALFEIGYLAAVWMFAQRMRAARFWEPPLVQPIDNLAKDELVI